MEPDGLGDDADNLHSKVLQATLCEIASRPTATTTAHGDASDDAGASDAASRCCVICLDVVTDPCETRPCGHLNFDFLCLVNWLDHRPSCPLCKADITQVRYQFKDGGNSPSSPPYSTYNVPPAPKSKETQTASRPARPPSHGSARLGFWGNRFPPRSSARRPPRPSGPTTTTVESEDDRALARRRRVYELKPFSLHVGTNRITRYTDLTPQMFDSDPTLVSRARMWIRRELRVFDFLCVPDRAHRDAGHTSGTGNSGSTSASGRSGRQLSSNAEFLLEYVVAILRTMDIKGSRGQAEEMLQEFLGREDTRLFLHELRAWLRSPYMTLEAWDAHVQYDEAKVTPAARIRRDSADNISREEGQGRRPAAYPDLYRGRDASGGSRWSPYQTTRRSVADGTRRR